MTVWALPRSLAATYGIDVSFSSSAYLDVSVQRVPSVWLWIHHTVHMVLICGFPHSEIHGSLGMCPSPWLIAACRVLLRLPVPRHPPCALPRWTICIALQLATVLLYRTLPRPDNRRGSLAGFLPALLSQFFLQLFSCCSRMSHAIS